MDQNEGPTVRVQAPSGEQGPASLWHSSARPPLLVYTPPSRQRVAEVIAECEASNTYQEGESPVGALLRAASKQLYWDGTTDRHKTIFPHALLVEALTRERIQASLRFDSPEAGDYSCDDCFGRIRGDGGQDELGKFARIFAVLLLCNIPQHIFGFFNNDLNDDAFPFKVGSTGIRSKVWNRNEPDFDLGWTSQCCESFVNTQWRVFLPFFKEGHQKFEGDTIMPWHDYHFRETGGTSSTATSTDGGMSGPGGGFSVVSRVVIHDGHYSFDGLSPKPGSLTTFAVKRLRTEKEEEFNKEVAMLRSLGGKKPHTVRLLATFRHGRTYCLVFPWAECDLAMYWTRQPDPSGISGPLVVWVAAQCYGLVCALKWIHNPDGEVLDPQNRALFGRHGDIKPENILWYKKNSDGAHPLASGELVVSDFGLSSLNHKDTRSNIMNGNIPHTRTYAPPESVLPENVISRSIDIWSLGCVFLEFVTWLIGGCELVGQFQAERMSPFMGSNISNAIFWEMQAFEDRQTGSKKPVTVLKSTVVEWIQTLHGKPRATTYIHDFLDIIANRMLIVEKDNRGTAEELVPMFAELKRRCERDPSYYTKPATRSAGPVVQFPVVHPLSIEAQEAFRRSSQAMPLYSGQMPGEIAEQMHERVQLRIPRGGATHLRP
ncbi:hypothetical protein MFIFM68171_06578 [Madurella fahalii]|uniref:Protein kinase domain-containing protein n=1 Tax=Madurella fahalii TaxID=1157608 RepID=A0ABQ0GF31_9PEZI